MGIGEAVPGRGASATTPDPLTQCIVHTNDTVEKFSRTRTEQSIANCSSNLLTLRTFNCFLCKHEKTFNFSVIATLQTSRTHKSERQPETRRYLHQNIFDRNGKLCVTKILRNSESLTLFIYNLYSSICPTYRVFAQAHSELPRLHA